MSLRNGYLNDSVGRKSGDVNPAVHPVVAKVLVHLTLDRVGPAEG
jgi:hypothetical protein